MDGKLSSTATAPFLLTRHTSCLPYSLPLNLSFSYNYKAGFLPIFLKILKSVLIYKFLPPLHPISSDMKVGSFVSFTNGKLTCQISKMISCQGVNKSHMETRFYIIWNFDPWIFEYQIAIRFSELNEHLRNYQMGPVHDWNPCLISVNRLGPEFFLDEMFTVYVVFNAVMHGLEYDPILWELSETPRWILQYHTHSFVTTQ